MAFTTMLGVAHQVREIVSSFFVFQGQASLQLSLLSSNLALAFSSNTTPLRRADIHVI